MDAKTQMCALVFALIAVSTTCQAAAMDSEGKTCPTHQHNDPFCRFTAALISKRQTDDSIAPCIEALRGRDGRDGRDGLPGPRGLPGVDGMNGMKGMKGMQGDPGPSSGGVTYVRWGRTTCPNTPGTELVYRGRAAGSNWASSGGGANYQCVTEQPESLAFGPGISQSSIIHGAEYATAGHVSNLPSSTTSLHRHDAPCAVCYVSTRVAILMIPGRYTCPQSWTREYYGYLMAERHSHHRTTFECVDVAPETLAGGHAFEDGPEFYHVEPRCGTLPCPPYDPQKEMTCAVCTR